MGASAMGGGGLGSDLGTREKQRGRRRRGATDRAWSSGWMTTTEEGQPGWRCQRAEGARRGGEQVVGKGGKREDEGREATARGVEEEESLVEEGGREGVEEWMRVRRGEGRA
ncbi:uncharacterized protein A4U43_C03F22260 [Asparagus officinalis]|uniref:Uncharacterized protein n=1 Tax=Asparagus officinalis TaxID=4686 RepID=A0A5P1FGE9_ASPOF|nr:uncharacterized protein A4U43_C03F22260 [Asparagus officinalis]